MSNLPQVIKDIQSQIGGKAFYMLGAKNIVYGTSPYFLSFRIRGSKKANYIKVTYNEGLDVYSMEFGKIHADKYKVVAEFEQVYCDQLHELIEETTGLYTSL